MHMICANSLHLFIDLRYCGTFISAFYWETSGRSLNQEGVYVTSRSGALTKLIIWGHLLASVWIFMMIKHLSLMMMRHDRWHFVLLLWYKQVLLTHFYWVCKVLNLEDAEASVEPLGLRIESGSVLFGLIYLLWYFIDLLIDVDMFWHDCQWCRWTIACQTDSHME